MDPRMDRQLTIIKGDGCLGVGMGDRQTDRPSDINKGDGGMDDSRTNRPSDITKGDDGMNDSRTDRR